MEVLKNAEEQSFGESSLITTDSPAIGERNVGSNQDKKIESVEILEHIKALNAHKGVIDTTAPIDSVKSAVSKFGGIIDWKAHKVMALEKHTVIQHELENVQEAIPKYKKQSESAQIAKDQVLEELDSTKKLIEELKDTLEKTVTEEAQAKQDSELAQLRVKEMEQGISDDASTAAKAQLEVAKARHESAIDELKAVKEELAALQGDYHRLVSERNFAISRSEEVVSHAKDAEKKAEDLTLELITIKEALESAHASHLEAEERRIGVAMDREQDSINYEKELKQAQDELQQLNDRKLSTEDLRSKLETASTILLNLKTELAFYLEGETNKTQIPIKSELASAKKELEEVNTSIEKAKDEVNCLKEAASSLKAELEDKVETVTTLRQRGGMSSATISSLKAELTRMQSELELVLTKEREAREKKEELPKVLDQATHDTDQAKSLAHLASEELKRAKEEAKQIEAGVSTMETRLVATLKEIEATKKSQALAIAAVKAMLESEPPDNNNGVTLELEEYYKLSKDAYDAEESANERVISAIEKIKEVKNSEQIELQKLEEAHKELEEKKEAFKKAVLIAEKANEGKLSAEQELREWRAENELRRRVSDAATSHIEMNHSENYAEANRCFNGEASLRINTMSCPDLYADQTVPELKPGRRKSFFPRFVMFLARKKAQSLK